MSRHENGPRRRARAVQNTNTTNGKGNRFVPGFEWTCAEVEHALATADVHDLIRAADLSVGLANSGHGCNCPACGALRTVEAQGRWHWRCSRCHQLGSWLSLRQTVALSVETTVRLCGIVLGRREVAS